MENVSSNLHYSQGCGGYEANTPENTECEAGIHVQFYTSTLQGTTQRPLHLRVIYLPGNPTKWNAFGEVEVNWKT